MNTESETEHPRSSEPVAERMRRYRERRRKGMRSVRVELHVTDIEAFIRIGYLEEELRDDPVGHKAAVEMLVGDVVSYHKPRRPASTHKIGPTSNGIEEVG